MWFQEAHEKWGSETGKQGKPAKCVLMSRLPLWATGAQSHWGPSERPWNVSLTVILLRVHEVRRFIPTPFILCRLRVTPRTWTLWFTRPYVASRLVMILRDNHQAIESQDTITLYGNCEQMASWVDKEDTNRALMPSAMPFGPGNHMQKFILPLCLSQWVDEG